MCSSLDDGSLYHERIKSSANCFEDGRSPFQPVHIIDVPAVAKTKQPRGGQIDLVKKACANLSILDEHLGNAANSKFRLRLM